jgi:Anti-sigma-K factor rskA/Putative zinc-finger
MEPHDEFLELCALSTSGDLTGEEQAKLQGHLAQCRECRQALREFEAAVDVGMPLLSSGLAATPTAETQFEEAVHIRLVTSGVEESTTEQAVNTDGRAPGKRTFAFAHRNNGHQPTGVNWNSVWLPFAASILLSVALATYTYRVGKGHHSEVVSESPSPNSNAGTEALEQQISDTYHERQDLKAQLAERDKLIASLRHQIDERSSTLERLKTTQANLQQSAATDEAETQRVAADRAAVAQRLDAAQATIQKMQAELESARQQRSEGGSQDASLQAQIMELNGQLRDREQTIGKQEDLLSHDRDIRDLMGARDLYIAEVYDIGRDGATQKPCGRVFYTKGKSLVFYAYDLDQQPGVRNARTFQAWGRRGADMQEAVNLGIFFEDNAAKKRWVVKFDDAKSLEQIDAVFVTVEPNGGSRKPSGKPLLFAYLKVDPNHP